MGCTLVVAPASAAEANVPDELAKNGGTIEMVAAGESKTLEISPGKAETQKETPAPYRGYKDSSQVHVKSYTRAGLQEFGGHASNLRCGSYGPGSWGLCHIGERHKGGWANRGAGTDWFDMMEFATKLTLKKSQIVVRKANDTYNYCAPVKLKCKGKTYDTFNTNASVSFKGTNIITTYQAKKCE